MLSLSQIFFFYAILIFTYGPYLYNDAAKDDKYLYLMNNRIDALKGTLRIYDNHHTNSNRNGMEETWKELGILLLQKQTYVPSGGYLNQEALDAFTNALSLHHANNGKANINVDESVDVMKRKYDFLRDVYNCRGIVLKMMGRGYESIREYEYAFNVSITSQQKAVSLYNKGISLQMIGDTISAVHAFKQSLSFDPTYHANYFPLVECYKELKLLNEFEWYTLIDEMKQQAESSSDTTYHDTVVDAQGSVLSHTHHDSKDSSILYWALFCAYDVAGLYDDAWKHLNLAHGLEIKIRGKSDIAAAKQQLQHSIDIFTPSFFSNKVGVSSRVPVFIIGMMRSGSTLLETILDSHSSIWGLGEDSIFNAHLEALRSGLVDLGRSNKGLSDLQATVSKYGTFIISEMKTVAKLSMKNYNSSSDGNTKTSKNSVKRILDKMLFNYRSIGFIHLVYPNAVILHTMRDPLDTLVSCFTHKFDYAGLEWSLDMEQLIEQYILYLRYMHHYKSVLGDSRIYDVHYEKLVANPNKVVKGVLSKLGVAWDDTIMSFYNSKRNVQTNSASQVRHSISNSSVGTWKRYAQQLQPYLPRLKSELLRLKSINALPYLDEYNWDLDPSFTYAV